MREKFFYPHICYNEIAKKSVVLTYNQTHFYKINTQKERGRKDILFTDKTITQINVFTKKTKANRLSQLKLFIK